jgi:tRNA-dihydrouridine synthase 1
MVSNGSDVAVSSFLKDLKKKHKTKKKGRGEEHGRDNEKKRKKEDHTEKAGSSTDERPFKRRVRAEKTETVPASLSSLTISHPSPFSFPIRYICAPMVGASELPFRLLCRKYGTELAYTPMMSAHKFAFDADYRKQEFSTCSADRPLVCHFAANEPADFAAAAVQASTYCDAIDLNLGCPQRTAYLGHFGSYLLDPVDRKLLCDIIKAGAAAVNIPIFVKIRLLSTLQDTVQLCKQLRDAGVSLIAIHARCRANWDRKGPGARDGAALLDQVTAIKEEVPGIPIITNGNTITYQDVIDNLNLTGADGLMSAEGLLDNPALFLPRLGSREETKKQVTIPDPLGGGNQSKAENDPTGVEKKKRKFQKKLRAIERIEEKMESEGESALTDEEREKLSEKAVFQACLDKLEGESDAANTSSVVSLGSLYKIAENKLELALEYLELASAYPATIRTVIFHTRRMLKDSLVQYQLLEECLACENVQQVHDIVMRIKEYRASPASFTYDREKAKEVKVALERKKREEGKRKAYEARMMRKAKREGKTDLMVRACLQLFLHHGVYHTTLYNVWIHVLTHNILFVHSPTQHYLHIGAQVPTPEIVAKLKALPRNELMTVWKTNHAQHCLSFHMDEGGCPRDRTCAFLHVENSTSSQNVFVEKDEVAG